MGVTAKKFSQIQKFGAGRGKFSFQSASKFVQLLIVRSILKEILPSSNDATNTATISIGPEARGLLNNELSEKRLE